MNAESTSKIFSCTKRQAVEQMKKNLRQLERMLAKAESTGRKVNGYTADDLRHIIAKIRRGWGV